jgi:hypothetical protein
MLLPGVKSIRYRTLNELWLSLLDVLQTTRHDRTYSYVYWGDLDELSHRYGPNDARPRRELDDFARSFARFAQELRKQVTAPTLLLLSADHGQVDTPLAAVDDLREHRELLACLTMQPSGEHRLAYLYPRAGREERLREIIRATWDEGVRLVPSSQALQAGLFGPAPVYAPVEDRIGDWIAFPQGGRAWWWAARENKMLGRHGGLSRAEMLVPLLALPLP